MALGDGSEADCPSDVVSVRLNMMSRSCLYGPSWPDLSNYFHPLQKPSVKPRDFDAFFSGKTEIPSGSNQRPAGRERLKLRKVFVKLLRRARSSWPRNRPFWRNVDPTMKPSARGKKVLILRDVIPDPINTGTCVAAFTRRNSARLGGSAVRAPVMITPSARKNSACLISSRMSRSPVNAWEQCFFFTSAKILT